MELNQEKQWMMLELEKKNQPGLITRIAKAYDCGDNLLMLMQTIAHADFLALTLQLQRKAFSKYQ